VTYFEASAVTIAASLLIAGGWFFASKTEDTSSMDDAVRTATHIRNAAQSFRAEHEQDAGCPSLSQLMHEKFLEDQARTDDPWGQRFRLECSKDEVTVMSPGRDGKLRTDDDIRVPRPQS
jgi:general secretion pathway protein G